MHGTNDGTGDSVHVGNILVSRNGCDERPRVARVPPRLHSTVLCHRAKWIVWPVICGKILGITFTLVPSKKSINVKDDLYDSLINEEFGFIKMCRP